MKTLFVLMGHGKSKKSSVIRCLTGASSRIDVVKVKLRGNSVVDVKLRMQSPQEYKFKTPEELELEFRCFEYAMTPLRFNSVGKNVDGLTYIKYFENNGWVVKCIVLQNLSRPKVTNHHCIDITNMTNGEIAKIVRAKWCIV